MIWIANISIPTSSPPVAPGPFVEDQQTADPLSSHQPGKKWIVTCSLWESGLRFKVKVMWRDFTKLPMSMLPASSRSCLDLQSELEEDSHDERCHHWQGTWTLQTVTQKPQRELSGGRHGVKQTWAVVVSGKQVIIPNWRATSSRHNR